MEWISVKTALPDPDHYISRLVWLKDDLSVFGEPFDFDVYWQGHWVVHGGRVTHWLEIEPPKEE